MLFKKTPVAAAKLDSPNTVIGKGVYLEAVRMTGQDSIRIEGIFKGSIDIEGSLVLGESGSIIGDVNASYFLVAGEINGSIKCNTQLHFASTAKVAGDIQTPSLIADEGCQVSGSYMVGTSRQKALQNSEELLHIEAIKHEDFDGIEIEKDIKIVEDFNEIIGDSDE